MSTLTKPGSNGTLYRYRITYHDPHDDGQAPQTWNCWAYNVEHALEKFYGDGGDGYEATHVETVKST